MFGTSGSGVMEDDLPAVRQTLTGEPYGKTPAEEEQEEERVVYEAHCNQYYNHQFGTVRSPLIPVRPQRYGVDCSWTIDGGKSVHFQNEILHVVSYDTKSKRIAV